jgi:hypothetical protein
LDRLQHQVDFDRADQDDGEQESCDTGDVLIRSGVFILLNDIL